MIVFICLLCFPLSFLLFFFLGKSFHGCWEAVTEPISIVTTTEEERTRWGLLRRGVRLLRNGGGSH